MEQAIRDPIGEHARLVEGFVQREVAGIKAIADSMIECLGRGGTVFWCGNGGSAADSQHMAAELMGRFKRERRALRSVALTTDTSILTSLANDYGYEHVFSRQLEGLAREGDLLLAISTSGNSPNVLHAVRRARALGMRTVGLLGRGGGALRGECDLSFVVPSDETARIQEIHLMVEHILCELVESHFS